MQYAFKSFYCLFVLSHIYYIPLVFRPFKLLECYVASIYSILYSHFLSLFYSSFKIIFSYDMSKLKQILRELVVLEDEKEDNIAELIQ